MTREQIKLANALCDAIGFLEQVKDNLNKDESVKPVVVSNLSSAIGDITRCLINLGFKLN